IVALSVNLPNDASGGHGAERLVTVSFIAALLYGASRWGAGGVKAFPRVAVAMPAAYRWAATVLLLLLICQGFAAVSVPPACVLLALLLLEIGLWQGLKDLRMQSYAALGLAFAAIFFVSPRLYTVLPVVLALYYVHLRIAGLKENFEMRFRATDAAGWCGAVALAAML